MQRVTNKFFLMCGILVVVIVMPVSFFIDLVSLFKFIFIYGEVIEVSGYFVVMPIVLYVMLFFYIAFYYIIFKKGNMPEVVKRKLTFNYPLIAVFFVLVFYFVCKPFFMSRLIESEYQLDRVIQSRSLWVFNKEVYRKM